MVKGELSRQLFFDNIVYALQPFGGISNYWFELTRRFLSSNEFDIHFFETGSPKDNLFRKSLTIDPEKIVNTNRGGIITERFFRIPLQVKGKGIFHSSYFRMPHMNTNLYTVTTVHDFIHEKYHGYLRTMLHNYAKRRAINESNIIITVSNNTRNDLLNYYPNVDENRVIVIHNGVSEHFKPLPNKNKLLPKFVLYVGSRDHYKNFNFVLEVLSMNTNLELVVIGKPFSKTESKLLHSKLKQKVTLLTGIDTIKLNELYNSATCLFYPSSYEGFGIPLVESMKAGCPFIALKGSSITEVAGNAGILLETLNVDEASNAIQKIEKSRESLIEKGFVQSEKFSWQNCFNETQNIYKTLLA